MIPVYQTIQDSKHGNCYAACIASILECSLTDVPNFMADGTDKFSTLLNKWLKNKAFTIISINMHRDIPYITESFEEVYSIGTVKSSRFKDGLHAVVCKGFDIIHDPNPDVYPPYTAEILYFDVFIIKRLSLT